MNNTRGMIYKVENARITYRNFRGEARQYNNAGNRNFNLILNEEDAAMLKEAGFRVRERSGKDGYKDDTLYLLQVNVSYKYREPRIMTISGKNKVELTEETVGQLDYADIEHIDLTLRPYHWEMPDGRTGVKAYLNSMYVTLVTDPFDAKYSDLMEEEEESEYVPF